MGFQSGIKEEKSLKMLWNNFKVAFAMYSKIPMPMADWNKENMKYTFCFFPFIGLVIGALSYLVGWAGIYYPIGSLHEKAFNEEAIHRIVPGRGSDIWFWAAAIANNTDQICLGLPEKYNLGVPIPQNNKTKPKDTPGNEVMEQRFQMAIDFFNIREKLNATLPNIE
mgnify:CR=1 FL=1